MLISNKQAITTGLWETRIQAPIFLRYDIMSVVLLNYLAAVILKKKTLFNLIKNKGHDWPTNVSNVPQDGQLCCSYDYGCAGDLGSERSNKEPGWQSGLHSLPYVAGDQPEQKSSTGGELSSPGDNGGGVSPLVGPTAAGVVKGQQQASHQLPEQAAVTGKVAATSVA